ncbi:MAG: sigma-70 family RNA polymerase sigma factor [Muribaculaceae bacterium]|nr:sigma-70 family RNA polymerase sigma factor [Muribaculaceae bacterium]
MMILDTDICPRLYFPIGPRMRILWSRVVRLASFSAEKGKCHAMDLEREFNALVSKENATISKICFSYANSVAEFDDLRQDALINIWRGIQSFRGEASHRTWIYRVTVNSCISTLRRQSRHKHESLEELYGLIYSDNTDKEAIEQMYRAISTLGIQEKAIIMMWLDELTYEEIAAAMGLNRNTIATKIRRIKDKIIKEYKKEEAL